jgi:hypothetical protein
MAQLDAIKDVELLKWFPVSMMTQHGRQLLIHHLPRFFKELPPLDESVSYLYGWLAGLLRCRRVHLDDGHHHAQFRQAR